MKKTTTQLLSVLLVVALLIPLCAAPVAAESRHGRNRAPSVIYESDGTRIERGWIGDTYFESRTKGNMVTTTIRTGSAKEVVSVDRNSPFFTVTVNGVATVYDRRAFILRQEDIQLPPSSLDLDDRASRWPADVLPALEAYAADMIGTEAHVTTTPTIGLDVWFGSQYSNRWIGARSITTPVTINATAFETYTHRFASRRTLGFAAWTAVSVLVGALELAFNTVLATVSSVVAIVGGVKEISEFVTIERNEVRQDWNRFVRIAQDANNGIWYWAGRTAWNVVAIGPSGVGFQAVSDTRHWDFNDVNLLMQTAINNYLRHLGLPLH